MGAPGGIEITGPIEDRFDAILTPRALELVGLLHREGNGRRLELLAARQRRVEELAAAGATASRGEDHAPGRGAGQCGSVVTATFVGMPPFPSAARRALADTQLRAT